MQRKSRFIAGCLLCTASLWLGAAIGFTVDAAKRDVSKEKIHAITRQLSELKRERVQIYSHLNSRFDSAGEGSEYDFNLTTAEAKALINRVAKRIHAQEKEISALRQQIDYDLIRDRIVVINKVATAYSLVPPKLLMSVKSLRGGPVTAYFGDKTRFFNIGQRVDLEVGGRKCFLILLDSVRGQATFRFGCDGVPESGVIADTKGTKPALQFRRTSIEF